MSEYNREQIKLRMLKRVAMLWDIPDIEYVDPVVRLLIEAMAEEIFTLSGEMDHLDDRLLSKLSASMTPVSILTARPSHSILSATPIEATATIDQDAVFEYREVNQLRKYNVDVICFTPITPFDLVKATIRFINVEGRLYKYDGQCRKHIVGLAQKRDNQFNNSVWIGIEVAPEITFLENVSFYFDFMNVEDKYAYLQLLSHTKWSVAGKELVCRQGLGREQSETDRRADYRKGRAEVILSDLRAIYDPHYITLTETETEFKENHPQDWADCYSGETLSLFTTPLLWIKITFPPSIPGEILDYLRVGVNLLPVVNLSKKTINREMTIAPMFMPLETNRNEYFVEVDSVKDSSGKTYELLSTSNYSGGDEAKGTYSLRSGGVEQYSRTNDTRSAILRLTDIIRDRNLLSNSKADNELRQAVEQILVSTGKISDMIKSLDSPLETKSYILVDRGNPRESLIADYWVTNGEVINGFKPIVLLKTDKYYSSVLENNLQLLMPVRGGQAPSSADKMKDLHRYMLTSHDRIVTKHDILNFCKAEYGQYIDDMRVEGGKAIGKKPHQGLINTIDIHITRSATQLSGLSKENFKAELERRLSQRSPESFNYRIFIS